MITSLIIRNFRIFKEIKIDGLKRVNLFVGKNNSGKSCLIEALQIYAVKGNPQNLIEIISARDEEWDSSLSKTNEFSVNHATFPFSYLFHGFALPEIGGEAIEIGTMEDDSQTLKIALKAFQIVEDEEGRRKRTSVEKEDISDDYVDIQFALEATQGNERCHHIPFNSALNPMRNRLSPGYKNLNINHQVVPTSNLTDEILSQLWDNINLTDLEDEVISCLKIIDPKIEGIALVGDLNGKITRKSKRIPIIRYKGIKERIPLKTMGDGMTRLFHIILALVNVKNGLLLIDEFENGLHWSTHPTVWDTVIRLAKELNIQIIATTHSRDCIKGFHEAWASDISSASFYRLEADPLKGQKVIRYSCETLSDAIDTAVEVR